MKNVRMGRGLTRTYMVATINHETGYREYNGGRCRASGQGGRSATEFYVDGGFQGWALVAG